MVKHWINRSKEVGLTYPTMFFIIIMSILTTFTEIFGLGIFLPIFQYIKMKGDIEALISESEIWKHIVNTFSFFNTEVSLSVLLFIAFSFFIGRQIFTYIRVVFKTTISYKLVKKLRNKIFDNYLSANTSFHDNVPIGNISNTITVEIGSAILSIMQPLELISYLIMALGYLSILFLLSWQMTIVAVVVLLFASLIPNVWIKQSAKVGRDLTKANTILSTFLITRLKSPRLVRLAGTQTAENKEFSSLTQKQCEKSIYSAKLLAKTDVVLDPIIIGLSLIFLYVSYTSFSMQIEVIGLYLVIALRIMPVSKSIISQWQSIQNLLGPLEMVEDGLNEMKKSKELNNGNLELKTINESIQFIDVSYSYPESNANALTNISIKIPANRVTALVGPSGSGKSTFIDLLPLLRVPSSGVIKVDSIDINKYTLNSLRNAISYVPQSPQIFDGTIAQHIRYGKSNASNNELIKAAQLAGINLFIEELPLGYDTNLGEDAIRLSGGQKQRLDIARALVSKPKIIILDEPTSNLDANSEEEFRLTMQKIRENADVTIIIISHRLYTIADSDQIIVLNNGVVESVGKHIDLIKHNEWYGKAYKIQNMTS